MTLKEKLFNIVFDNAWTYKHENTIPELEKITEEFAIEFAEWCDDNYFKNGKGSSNWSESLDWDDDKKLTTKQLLEIFKKEKGL